MDKKHISYNKVLFTRPYFLKIMLNISFDSTNFIQFFYKKIDFNIKKYEIFTLFIFLQKTYM